MMTRRSLWQVTITASLEAEDPVLALMEEVLAAPASSYYDLRTGRHSASCFLERQGAWTAEKRKALRAGLRRMRSEGLGIGPGRITAVRLPARNWAESWKRHFPPIRIGSRLLVLPTWMKRTPAQGQQVVVLDPGLSFGTGHHPTTSYCLTEIVAAAPDEGTAEGRSFLDLGTGSGILAIAAARLGYRPIRAVEHDGEALRVARANARQNGVRRRIRFSQEDVRRLPVRPRQRFSLVCANLISNLLVAETARLWSQVADGGTLVLAGILTEEFEDVRRRYESAGACLVRSERKQEWHSGTFRRLNN